MQKITISQEASDRKDILGMPEKMGFLVSKRNSFSDPDRLPIWKYGYLYWFRINIPVYEIVVNLRIKVEFESILVSFPSFIPFQHEQPTKDY